MEDCFFHYDSVGVNEKLLLLSSADAWNTILNAAKIRNNEKVFKLQASVSEGEYPRIKFHKSCRSMFTMKRDLDKLKSKGQVNDEARKRVHNARTSSKSNRECGKLETRCIFCKKQKYLKNSKTRETLLSCTMFSADEKIKEASKIRSDAEIIVLSADDLIAKEAHYHATCYRLYTLVIYTQNAVHEEGVEEEYHDDEEEAFETVKQKLCQLYGAPDIIEFIVISSAYEDCLGHTRSKTPG